MSEDQYGFIMNPQKPAPKRRNLLPDGGISSLSKKQLIMFGAGGFILLAVLFTIALSVLNSGPSNKDHLLTVVAQQNELIRVSEIAVKEARGTQARNLAQTTRLSLRSDQASLTAALKAQKVKIGGKELGSAKDPKTDQLLEEATQNNRFDEVYLEFIQKALVDYQKNLNTAYQSSVNVRLKETMKIQYENASIIIGVDPEA